MPVSSMGRGTCLVTVAVTVAENGAGSTRELHSGVGPSWSNTTATHSQFNAIGPVPQKYEVIASTCLEFAASFCIGETRDAACVRWLISSG